jgi:hypothetical protein
MLKKISAVCIGFLTFQAVDAQSDSTKKSSTTFTGSLDAYYRYNFNAPAGSTNNYTSFTNSNNSFELGMASVKVDHSFGKVAATIDLGFGRRAQEFSYNDVGTTLTAVKQAYLSYAASDKVKLTIGKWATHVGYELVDAYANRNYSMSYGFSYGPFFHTGVKADIALGGKTGLMMGVANLTDYVTDPNGVKVFVAQLSTGFGEKVKAFLNYQGGTGLSQLDLVVTAALSDKFNIGYDGTLNTTTQKDTSTSWRSHALYLNFDPSKTFGLTVRGEYFDDRKVSPLITSGTAIANKIFATTISGNFRIDNLTIIPELRFDSAKGNVFLKNDSSPTSSTASFLIAAVYKF